MAAFLKEHGVADGSIYLENHARNTQQNLSLSIAIVVNLRKQGRRIERIGVLVAGFRAPRTRMLAEGLESYRGENVTYFAAYGPNTGRDNWYANQKGRDIVLDELRKTAHVDRHYPH